MENMEVNVPKLCYKFTPYATKWWVCRSRDLFPYDRNTIGNRQVKKEAEDAVVG